MHSTLLLSTDSVYTQLEAGAASLNNFYFSPLSGGISNVIKMLQPNMTGKMLSPSLAFASPCLLRLMVLRILITQYLIGIVDTDRQLLLKACCNFSLSLMVVLEIEPGTFCFGSLGVGHLALAFLRKSIVFHSAVKNRKDMDTSF